MALVGHISGSSQSNSVIGVSGSVIVANRPNSLFPSLPGTDVTFFVSGALDNTNVSVFGGKLVVSGGINSTTISGSGDFNVGGDLRIAGDLISPREVKNVVSEIKGRYSDGCCYDCDGIYKYNHKKVPVLYLKIYIRPSQI